MSTPIEDLIKAGKLNKNLIEKLPDYGLNPKSTFQDFIKATSND